MQFHQEEKQDVQDFSGYKIIFKKHNIFCAAKYELIH